PASTEPAVAVPERPLARLEPGHVLPLALLFPTLVVEGPVLLPVPMVVWAACSHLAVRVALDPIGCKHRDSQHQGDNDNYRHEKQCANRNPYPSPNAHRACQPPDEECDSAGNQHGHGDASRAEYL